MRLSFAVTLGLVFLGAGSGFGVARLDCRRSSADLVRPIRLPTTAQIRRILDKSRYPSAAAANRALALYGMEARPANPRSWLKGDGREWHETLIDIAWKDDVIRLPILDPSAVEGKKLVKAFGQNHYEMYEATVLGVPVMVKVDKVRGPEDHGGMIYETAAGLLFNKLGEGPLTMGLVFLTPGKLGTVMQKVEGVHNRDMNGNSVAKVNLRALPENERRKIIASIKRVRDVFIALGINQGRSSEIEVILTPGADAVPIDFGGQRLLQPGEKWTDPRLTPGVFQTVINSVAEGLGIRP